jgi:GNAT superfamily N-acetyltransferase
VQIHSITPTDHAWLCDLLTAAWGSPSIISISGVHDASQLPGFVAHHLGQRVGLLTYALDEHGCEVVTLNALLASHGVGTALLDALANCARTAGCQRLWLTTTNDNTAALRFYQRRGWDLVAVYPNVVTAWRQRKPEIPAFGHDGIPIRHALELQRLL